ncbi:MAG: radical SAM protein [Candidatus Omnitrophota bacterium]|nr:radical SAM protein [Candidatus Omnitrophota bacterium]
MKTRNQYTLVHLSLLALGLRKGKITLKKLLNVAYCYFAYTFQLKKSGRSPYMISIELWNECNANCVFCRDKKGVIYDYNPGGTGSGIEKGKMPAETAMDIIRQLKDYLVVAVLYTNGEPLIYQDLARVIKFAEDNGVVSVIASNGILLDENRSRAILEAGLDFIKIQLSGFTQDVYSVQIRSGNVERLKENIRNFARMKREGGYKTLILVDYILYNYNRHQVPMVRQFCKENGVMLNFRPGNPIHGLEDKEPALSTEPLPLKMSCDWLWKGMQINWNGDVLQCCEAVVWSKPEVYEKFEAGKSRLMDVWNGPESMAMRETMSGKGRGAIPMCTKCLRKGISFKW